MMIRQAIRFQQTRDEHFVGRERTSALAFDPTQSTGADASSSPEHSLVEPFRKELRATTGPIPFLPAKSMAQVAKNFAGYLPNDAPFGLAEFAEAFQDRGVTKERLNEVFGIFDQDADRSLNLKERFILSQYLDAHGLSVATAAKGKAKDPTLMDGALTDTEVSNALNAPELEKSYANFYQRISTDPSFKNASLNKAIFERHKRYLKEIESKLTPKMEKELEAIKAHYLKNKSAYVDVSTETGVPPELVAALHYREASCDMGTLPSDGWESIGVVQTFLGETQNSVWSNKSVGCIDATKSLSDYANLKVVNETDKMAAMLTLAERHNGPYYSNHDMASPYVYSGTNQYSRGLNLNTGYDKTIKDPRPGVYAVLKALEGL